MFRVYILQNPAGRFYIGHTDNLETRLANHNRTDKTLGKPSTHWPGVGRGTCLAPLTGSWGRGLF